MKAEGYIAAILRRTGLNRKTKRRLKADLQTDIEARLDGGESMEAVAAEMGPPGQVAQSLYRSMGSAAGRQRKGLRVAFLVLAFIFAALFLLFLLESYGINTLLAFWKERVTWEINENPATFATGYSMVAFGFADGPPATAILVTGMAPVVWPVLCSFALCAFGAWLYLRRPPFAGRWRYLVLSLACLGLAALMVLWGRPASGAWTVLFTGGVAVAVAGIVLVIPSILLPLALGLLYTRRFVLSLGGAAAGRGRGAYEG